MSKTKTSKPKAPTLDTVITVVDNNANALHTLAENVGKFADEALERFEEADSEFNGIDTTLSRHEQQLAQLNQRVNALLRLVLETAAPEPTLWQRIKARFQSYSVWSRDEA